MTWGLFRANYITLQENATQKALFHHNISGLGVVQCELLRKRPAREGPKSRARATTHDEGIDFSVHDLRDITIELLRLLHEQRIIIR
jgi:hypothetical protein